MVVLDKSSCQNLKLTSESTNLLAELEPSVETGSWDDDHHTDDAFEFSEESQQAEDAADEEFADVLSGITPSEEGDSVDDWRWNSDGEEDSAFAWDEEEEEEGMREFDDFQLDLEGSVTDDTSDGNFEMFEDSDVEADGDHQVVPVVPGLNHGSSFRPPRESEQLIKEIEAVLLKILDAVSCGRVPQIDFPRSRKGNHAFYDQRSGEVRALDQTTVNGLRQGLRAVKLGSRNSTRLFAVYVRILEICHGLLQDKCTTTKRDIFYMDVPLFGSQVVVDRAVDDIARMFNVPRAALNVHAASKGLVAGAVQIVQRNEKVVDCSPGIGDDQGHLIPTADSIKKLLTPCATFVIVIEKEATFRHLLSRGFCCKYPDAILVTGKGYPDIATRRFVNLLYESCRPTSSHFGEPLEDSRIPILALVDNDPHGIAILCTYKHGSKNLAHELGLATPSIKWIGLHSSDWSRFGISHDQVLPLSSSDRKKGWDLLKTDCLQYSPLIRRELSRILFNGRKAELQCLCADDMRYFTDVFLPQKLADPTAWL